MIASLSPEIACEVRDLLIRPPEDWPYDTLKAELIKRMATSEERKLQQLIGEEEFGDRKPTQLLRRMQQLLGDHAGPITDNGFLKELFLQRLPANVRMVLASADCPGLAKLADIADKIVEVAIPQTVAATSNSTPDITQLKEEVTRLSELVVSLTQQRGRPCGRSFSRDHRPQSPSHTIPNTPNNSGLCRYQKKFGEAAKKCQQPCNWGNELAGLSRR